MNIAIVVVKRMFLVLRFVRKDIFLIFKIN
jgi:hypothetical protein